MSTKTLVANRSIAIKPTARDVGVRVEELRALDVDELHLVGLDRAAVEALDHEPLEPLLGNRTAAASADSQPVLSFMATEQARENLRRYLTVSRLPGVQTLLKTAELGSTERFVPANRPGGASCHAHRHAGLDQQRHAHLGR